jgi:hypothetical protein
LLAGVSQCHLNASKETYPKHAEEIEKELYVDDLVTGETSVQEVREKNEASVEIFKEASFHLHKWQSDVKELEQNEQSDSDDKTTIGQRIVVLQNNNWATNRKQATSLVCNGIKKQTQLR